MQSTRIKRQLSIKRLGQERHCYVVCTYPKGMYQLNMRAGTTLLCSLHVSKGNVSIKGEGRNETVMLSKGNVSIKGEDRNDSVMQSKARRSDTVTQSTRFQR